MKAENFIETLPSGVSFEMVFVEGGRFMMGSEEEEVYSNEKPLQEITLSDFYIGKYPITQQLWKLIMGIEYNSSHFKGDNRPVDQVSWDDTQKFIEKLNKVNGEKYRLLTEAEWEYAARGGLKSKGFKYAGSNKLKDVAWFNGNSYGETKPVGLKYPNELGVYDMSGNIFEWVEDQYHDSYYGMPKDGSAWLDIEKGAFHVIRGGSWFNSAHSCRVAYRNGSNPMLRDLNIGFRLGLSFQSDE
jgi:sulfatase modifying factor 1